MNKNRVLMFFFVGSEAFFFLALIIAYVYYSHTKGVLSSSAQYLDVKRTSVFTFFLLSSSLTIWFADTALNRGSRKAILIWLSVTIALGIIFLLGQGSEYARLFKLNITINRNVFGSAFFTLTGFHGLHVFIGLLVLSIVFAMIYSDKFNSIESTALKSVSIYWHFVDIVWIAVFSVVYLGALL
jgi:heme/copper-type cytochrome/quinol oxidase subunit 3